MPEVEEQSGEETDVRQYESKTMRWKTGKPQILKTDNLLKSEEDEIVDHFKKSRYLNYKSEYNCRARSHNDFQQFDRRSVGPVNKSTDLGNPYENYKRN